jgi:hypothetical protein
MTWDCEQEFIDDAPVLLPCSFTSPVLAIEISATNYRSSWYRSGFLTIIIDFGGSIYTGQRQTLGFGGQLIEIPYSNYKLQFQPVQWLQGAVLKINQLSKSEIQAIMPLYSPMPTTIGEQPVIDSLPTTFNAPQYLAATLPAAFQALAANPARQTYSVTNTGTAPAYLDLDPPAGLTKRMVTIPVGGVYVSDVPYVGAVYCWSSNATAQALEVRELIQ